MFCCRCQDYVEVDELKLEKSTTYTCRRCKTTICYDEWGELPESKDKIIPILMKDSKYIAISTTRR